MPRALWAGASGMAAQQTNVDLIANNVANVNTSGFKRQRADFQDLFYETRVAPGARTGDQSQNPTGVQIGTGVNLISTTRIFGEGSIEPTGKDTDLAIAGDGFFEVSLPDGSTAFTRAGDFRIDANGSLVTPDGYFLVPNITVPDGASQVSVAQTGTVTALVNGAETGIGTLTLTRFRNNSGLNAIGRNLFQESPASGAPQQGTPGSGGLGTLVQGSLEKSNVEVVTELVNLIVAQRAYEMNSRTVKASDEMLQTANEIVR